MKYLWAIKSTINLRYALFFKDESCEYEKLEDLCVIL